MISSPVSQKTVARGNSPASGLQFLRRSVSRKLVHHFTRDLSIMLKARMLLIDSIDILARQNNDSRFQRILDHIADRLRNGAAFADALRAYPEVFDHFYVNLVEVGELTGQLPDMLSRIAGYLDKVANLKRKLIQALTYPALVIGVALCALSFILLYIIPTFSDIFRDFDAQLPWPTQVIIAVSSFFQENIFYLLSGGVALAMLLKYARSFLAARIFFDNLVLGIPLLGGLVRKNYISHFCRTLGTLLHSSISLLQALEIAARATRNYHIGKDIEQMKRFAARGEQLTASLHASRVFPLMVTRMIAVGEETAELPAMLIQISDLYDQEMDSMIETLASVIEPVIIVLLGLIIGAILVSIYLPLFNMSNIMAG